MSLPSSLPSSRRPAVLVGTGLAAAALLLPATAYAATAPVSATTDPAGDATAGLLTRSQPAVDILEAGVRADSSTVTFYTRLAQAPTQAQITGASYVLHVSLRIGSSAEGFNSFDVDATSTLAYGQATVSIQGPANPYDRIGNGPYVTDASYAVDPATNEVRLTIPREQLDLGIAASQLSTEPRPLAAGALVETTGADSSGTFGGLLTYGTYRDSAAAGPATVYGG